MTPVLLAAVMACAAAAPDTAVRAAVPTPELPAPPDRFVLQVEGGARLTGPPARIDIRHAVVGAAPAVEISFAAGDEQGTTWSVLVVAQSGFLRDSALQAQLSDRPLEPGRASLQRIQSAGGVQMADAGALQLSLRQGRLSGQATARGLGRLKFEGPYAVSCTLPASATAVAPPASADALMAQVVDEGFESVLCKPYAALGRGR